MVDDGPVAPRPPPASKEVVAKLPVITLTEEVLANMGKDTECAICRENLVLNDKMQELPCKHTFHPPCLKPWLVLSRSPHIYWKFYVVLLKPTLCIWYCEFLEKMTWLDIKFVQFYPLCGRMSTILVQSVGTSCKLMIMPMRAGRNVKKKPKKRGKVLKTLFEVVNTCMFRWLFNYGCPRNKDIKFSVGG